ncbi:hypothetical protein ACWCQ0_19790 [Streptomyces massasporeus]|uniref:Uncharacterized protein n=1 Tax=Streptomyces massasporeus TaxID=67324 RepID=A0ABW6LPW6_9ACTN
MIAASHAARVLADEARRQDQQEWADQGPFGDAAEFGVEAGEGEEDRQEQDADEVHHAAVQGLAEGGVARHGESGDEAALSRR